MSRRGVARVALALAGLAVVTYAGVVGLSDRISSPRAAVDDVTEAGAPDVRPTPALAQATVDRLSLFRSGRLGDRLVLTAPEVTALLRFGVPGVVPAGVVDPIVELGDDAVRISMRVATSHMPSARSIARVVGVLTDTVTVSLRGSIESLEGRLALVVDRLEVGHVPLPGELVDELLSAVWVSDPPEAPPATLWLPRPAGLGTAVVDGGVLELKLAEPIAERAVDGSDGVK
jgi:hypothetical protein